MATSFSGKYQVWPNRSEFGKIAYCQGTRDFITDASEISGWEGESGGAYSD